MKNLRSKTALYALSGFGFFFMALIVNSSNTLAATTIPNFTINCSSGIQLCQPEFSASVATTATWQAIQLKYDVGSGHCSSVRLYIFVDGALVKTTGYLGWPSAPTPFNALPLTTGTITLQYVRAGTHIVSINAEGQVSGCNSGTEASWGGSLQLLP